MASAINVPVFAPNTYNDIQHDISNALEDSAVEEMQIAANEERLLTIENGDVTTGGIPYITVVCDGVWAKRSYRTNYNSLSGAAAIVGYKTRKVLFLGVRNRFCLICKKHPVDTPEHACYKNWSGSACAMEADIIKDGFAKSVEQHDGDSSCYKKILDEDPYKDYNITVEKLECRNHLLRNYVNKIREIYKDTSLGPLVLRKIIKFRLERMEWFTSIGELDTKYHIACSPVSSVKN
nr:unnamed protein product [Callosobruchus analis]